MAIVLSTDRLILREWSSKDIDPFHAICSDPTVMRYVGDGEPWSRQRTQEWICDAIDMAAKVGYCRWALVLKATATLIGFCGYVPTPDGAEIGWRLGKDGWGQGFATEAAQAALRHGFDVLGLRRLTALVQSPNRASIRVCEKLGMSFESQFLRNGREVNIYAIHQNEAPGLTINPVRLMPT